MLSRQRLLFSVIFFIGIVTICTILSSPLYQASKHLSRVSILNSTESLFKSTESLLKGLDHDQTESVEIPANETVISNVTDPNASWTIPYSTASETDRIIANNTLGFQAIFVLGLPDRTYKRDSMELAASVTDLNITWQDGVLGDQMHPKAIPPVHTDPRAGWFRTDGEVGCWRGHMNIMQKIVKEKIASALIMEDDADWDLHIVQQMQQFANVSREFLADNSAWARKTHATTGSPYGEGWDILWVGHCGGWPAKDGNNHIAIISNDTTVPPAPYMVEQLFEVKNTSLLPCSAHLGRDPQGVVCDSPRLQPTERLVQERTLPLCTTGYAISLQGARKYLARIGGLSLTDVTAPIDWEMIEMCKEVGKKGSDREAARCLTVSPPYIRSHRMKGRVSSDSDIKKHGKDNETRDVGISEGLLYPARLNVENMIAGYEPEKQYILENGKYRARKATEYRSKP